MIRELTPKNAVQSSIQALALQVAADLAETRLTLSAQPTDSLLKHIVPELRERGRTS